MDTYNDKPKKTVEQVNLWYSESARLWFTCVWMPKELDHYITREVIYKREKHAHKDYQSAIAFLAKTYVGGTK